MIKQSINKRFNHSIILTVVVILLLFSVGVVIYGVGRMNSKLRTQLDYIASMGKTSLHEAVWNMDNNAINEILDAMFLNEDVVYLDTVIDGEVTTKRVRVEFENNEFNSFEKLPQFISTTNQVLNEGEEIAKIRVVVSNESLKKELTIQVIYMILFVLFLLLMIILRSIVFTRKYVFEPIKELENSASSIADGNLETTIHHDTDDEIGNLGKSFDRMRESLKKHVSDLNFAKQELEKRVEKRTEELSKSTEELKKAKEEALVSGRFKASLNELSTSMQGTYDVPNLAEKVTHCLAEVLKLPLVAFFVVNEENKFQRFADFGYPHRENLPDLFEIGSGLVGRAAVECKPIALRDIPDYAKASFGFGQVSPEEILLIPIIYDNQTIGVLELGNFKCFTEEQSVWLNEAARSISVVLRVVLDMSERKRNSEKLMISEKRLELALSGGDLGLWDVNFQTMKTTVNKRWAEILGYTIEEVKDAGSTWREGIHPDDYERVLRIGSDYREGRIHKYEVEYRVLTKQKDVKWVLSKGAIFERDKKGEPIRMVGTVMDITKLKKHV